MSEIVSINVTSDIQAAMNNIAREYPRAVEIASQNAVVKTAYKAKDAVVAEMKSVFSNPTRFTLNAFRVAINKKEMSAAVQIKDGYWARADNYLQTQIGGAGDRKQKAFEVALSSVGILPAGWSAVPGQGAKIDGQGNHSVGEIRQVLSWFEGMRRGQGSMQNMTDATRAKRRKGTKSKRGFEYFSVIPGRTKAGGGRQNLHPGIYRRTFFGFGGSISPIMIFVQRAAYEPLFDFNAAAEKSVKENFRQLLNTFLEEEISKAQAKRTGSSA